MAKEIAEKIGIVILITLVESLKKKLAFGPLSIKKVVNKFSVSSGNPKHHFLRFTRYFF